MSYHIDLWATAVYTQYIAIVIRSITGRRAVNQILVARHLTWLSCYPQVFYAVLWGVKIFVVAPHPASNPPLPLTLILTVALTLTVTLTPTLTLTLTVTLPWPGRAAHAAQHASHARLAATERDRARYPLPAGLLSACGRVWSVRMECAVQPHGYAVMRRRTTLRIA
jgi:hypothetical protein